ncbi:uncharacterized protein LOC116268094 [Nymphaea colorata]|uniref:uncharacterized protein LOC116268094 n=1 Tax=Nymphaea colorata TaxID=210225 RepID=UPI00129EBB24|nr:uncharacterized protein LOC116268094 [Nymphaea colorata]
MQTINAATVMDGTIVTEISDGGATNTYNSMAGLLTACGTSDITLFNTVNAGPPLHFNTLQISGYTADEHIILLRSPAGGGSFVTSSKYFVASGSALTIKLIYSQSGGSCGSIVIGSIAVVGYICDSSCSSCSMATSCSCATDKYLTSGNVCSACGTGCATCTASGCLTCKTSPTSYYLLGTTCEQSCGAAKYTGVNSNGEPVCLSCLGICATCTGPSTCSSCNSGRLFYGGTGCGANCPFGQYAADANNCDVCDSNCATCSDASTCTSCGLLNGVQSYLHSDNACHTSCPGATYAKVSNGAYLCVPCPSGCALCSLNVATVQCSKCQAVSSTSFYYSNNDCIQTCPDGTYGGNDGSGDPTCLPCDSPCATCSGSGSSACLTCSTDRLIYGTNTCGSCASGTYADSATTCAPCDTNCATCQTTAANCLSCGLLSSQQSYLHSDKVCYVNCPGNTYGKDNSGSYVCATCPTGCSTCSLVSGTVQCSLCTSVASLQYYLKNNACTSSCGNGFYGGPDPTTSEPTCLSCVAPCANCNSDTVCTSCSTGYYLSGTCHVSCPFGYYANTGTTCAQCDSNCASCDNQANECLSCGLLNSLQSYLYTDNTCYNTCPGGSYATSTGGVYLCTACPNGCATCSLVSGTVQCTVCAAVSSLNFYLSGTSCVQNCPSGKYAGTNGNGDPACLSCLGICATCAAPSTCSSCNSGRLFYGGTGCGANCPFGQYAADANNCDVCDSNCATCSDASTCTSCGLLNGVQSYLHSDNACHTSCPGATYAKVSNGAYLCVPCPSGCALCSLNVATVQCSKCQAVSSTSFYYSNNDCIQTCPDGTYGGNDGSGDPTCLPCDSPCATCSGSGSSACLTCSTDRLIYGTNTCGSCASGTYADSATTCAPCDTNCATCQTTAANCLSCGLLSSQQSYLHSDKVCYVNCPGNTYGKDNSGSYVCATCPTGCSTCSLVSGTVQCSLCTSVASLQYYLKNNACTSSCGNGFYGGPDPTTSEPTCLSCVTPCANCNSDTVCTSCSTGYYLSGTCHVSCPFGYYANTGTTCAQCDSNCASCVSQSTKCLSCGLLNNLQSYLYTDNTCYNTCPGGSYATSTSGVHLCTACPTGCTTCSLVSGTVQCTVCAAVSSLNFYLSGTSCVQNCPSGKYAGTNGNGDPACLSCDSPCATCTGAGASACLSCSTGRLIYNTNTCGSCASGTFANSGTTCAPCDANCGTCQTSATNCLTCGLISSQQSYLYSDNKCYTTCPAGSYKDDSSGSYLCTACPAGCAQCSLASGSVACSLCSSVSGVQFYLSGTSCVSSCGSGKYGGINSSLQPVCLSCVSPCNDCLSATACTSCSTGVLVFGTNTCTSQCVFGQYADTTTTCANCNSNCASCSSSATSCTSCISISGSKAYLHTDNTCYVNCPTGTYSSVVNGANLCVACPTGCDTCSYTLGSVTCSKCKTVSSTNFYLSGTSCVQKCPGGTYGGTDANGDPACVGCHSDCATCNGAGASACLTCSSARLIYGTNTCGSCASGTYADSATTCAQCNTNCATCDTSATNCLTCGLISSQQSYLYSDNKCYTTCPAGSYKDSSSGSYLCTACPAGCAQCSLVTGNVECTLCTSVAGVQFYLESKSCSSSCSSGKYGGIDSSFKPVCSSCQSPCATCLTATVCLTCSTGVLVYGTTFCSSQCPFGQYIDTSTTCAPCNANCASCKTSATTCTTCGLISGSQAYLYSDNVCYTTCPNGSYKSNVNGLYVCGPCPTGCALCSLNAATVECTECKTVSSTNFYLSDKSCVEKCPAARISSSMAQPLADHVPQEPMLTQHLLARLVAQTVIPAIRQLHTVSHAVLSTLSKATYTLITNAIPHVQQAATKTARVAHTSAALAPPVAPVVRSSTAMPSALSAKRYQEFSITSRGLSARATAEMDFMEALMPPVGNPPASPALLPATIA